MADEAVSPLWKLASHIFELVNLSSDVGQKIDSLVYQVSGAWACQQTITPLTTFTWDALSDTPGHRPQPLSKLHAKVQQHQQGCAARRMISVLQALH